MNVVPSILSSINIYNIYLYIYIFLYLRPLAYHLLPAAITVVKKGYVKSLNMLVANVIIVP